MEKIAFSPGNTPQNPHPTGICGACTGFFLGPSVVEKAWICEEKAWISEGKAWISEGKAAIVETIAAIVERIALDLKTKSPGKVVNEAHFLRDKDCFWKDYMVNSAW